MFVMCNDNTWHVSLWSPHHLEWAQPSFTQHLSFSCLADFTSGGCFSLLFLERVCSCIFSCTQNLQYSDSQKDTIILIMFCIYCTLCKLNVQMKTPNCTVYSKNALHGMTYTKMLYFWLDLPFLVWWMTYYLIRLSKMY